MAFGKRQSGNGAAAQAFNADMAAATVGNQVGTGSAAATGSPIRWLIALLACGAMLYGLVATARTFCATIAFPAPGNPPMTCASPKGSASEPTS
ncbi:hypothetical protein PMI42_05021 [Bradyrhizobium sp. YR681]|nr:hypothetical protein PMI42_05021 [Bradyrhizobium sp. YR681]